ncbi:MAG: tyrosine--tRNA ligase [Candidatus Yanofskybacteria bacterium]|nr:tyrosine--tRNA ligase [Candidatus Yanofskybacteria bacterium]
MNKIKEFLSSRYIEAVFPSKERVAEMMIAGKRLVFYWGIDPTGPNVHLGHTTNVFVMKKLAELGHKIILLIGDFTATIGDPTDKEAVRKPLTEKEVKENMKTYLEQIHKILSKGSFEVRYNSKWYSKMFYKDWLKVAMKFTQQQMIARDMFQERLKKDKPIGMHEFDYPMMQGYDSVVMNVDGEVGGNDQTFNMLVGRDLVKDFLGKEKIVIATRLLEDPVTRKKIMNKSEGQYVSLNDSAEEMFGRVMAMPDSAILPLFSYATEVSDSKISEIKKRLEGGENPMTVKKELAFELVKMYHDGKTAEKTKENFEKVFSEGRLPEKMEEFKFSGKIVELLYASGLAGSMSEAKRLIDQKAVYINGHIVTDWEHDVKSGDIVKVGPRRFLRIK